MTFFQSYSRLNPSIFFYLLLSFPFPIVCNAQSVTCRAYKCLCIGFERYIYVQVDTLTESKSKVEQTYTQNLLPIVCAHQKHKRSNICFLVLFPFFCLLLYWIYRTILYMQPNPSWYARWICDAKLIVSKNKTCRFYYNKIQIGIEIEAKEREFASKIACCKQYTMLVSSFF